MKILTNNGFNAASMILAICGICAICLAGTSALAQDGIVVSSLSHDGSLEFQDPLATGSNVYEVEWSSDLSEWRSSWSNLSSLHTINGESTTVNVPMFYRVKRVAESTTPLPAPVVESDFRAIDPARNELGKLLFWDKILSGNRNISCVTCHHTMAGTGDGLSLPIGEGGVGLGIMRLADATISERVPRNAPQIWNLGAAEFTTMFHDGRVEVDLSEPSGFASPAGASLPSGLPNVLAAQAMFPVTSGTEMAGGDGENEIGTLAAAGDLPGIWEALAGRLREIPEYVDLFIAAFDDITSAADITYVHAAIAIAEHESTLGRADNSPFDAYLRGETDALTGQQRRGMQLFYGKAKCADCHSGKFQTDHDFHAIAMCQIGPGKGDGDTLHADHGRARVTSDASDLYKFRTPSLRNVAGNGPWGHSGAYDELEAVVRHHLDPAARFADYD
ncbi:MAG: cytochrome c peroxidase [Verrucomicrobiales bacterium]|jgi:cytochrome c peroxidase